MGSLDDNMRKVIEEGEAIYTRDKSWIIAHERIIVLFAIILAVVFLGNKWIDFSRDRAIAKNAATQQVLQEQVETNANIAKQLAVQVTEYQKEIKSLNAKNASLEKAITERHVTVQKQQQVDKTLPLPELARRWELLANLQPDTIKSNVPEQALEVPVAGAVSTVQILETVAALQQDLKDVRTIGTNKDTEIGKLTGLNASLNTQVDGLKKELVDKDKACQTQIKEIQAKARKSKIRYFLTGLGIGIGVAAFVLH